MEEAENMHIKAEETKGNEKDMCLDGDDEHVRKQRKKEKASFLMVTRSMNLSNRRRK